MAFFASRITAESLTASDMASTIYGRVYGPFDLGGSAEVAELLGISKRELNILRYRVTFPQPAAELGMGPIWHLCQIRDWDRLKRK